MSDAYIYIRFSTTEQADGDSLRRQTEAAHRFVTDHNLVLKESSAFQDLGVSSFRGANLKQGLGRFIAEVDAGRVRTGSYLIVESVDRLSRQGVMDALQLLLSLIDKGIRVVTLTNGAPQVLDKQANFGQLVITLGTMYRANEESETKRMRGTEAWRRKKQNAATEPVTSRCPEWLQYNKAERVFEQIPERVATIRKIFELADEGVGRQRIVKFLNRNGYKSFRKPENGWQQSSVGKLLKNRSLIGCYQPHSVLYDPDTGKEKRIPDGVEHPHYYPTVIDVDLFRRVANRKHTRAIPLLGRQGAELTNLFTGMAFCMWCGARMSLCNKGRGSRGGRYLVCSSAVRGKGCSWRAWRYEHVEMLILVKLRELDLASILGDTHLAQELSDIRNEITRQHEQLETCQQTLANMNDSITDYAGRIPSGLLQRWGEEEEREESLRRQIEVLRSREQMAAQRAEDPAAFGDQLLKLYDAMDSSDADQNYLVRVRLRDRLGLLIERIDIRALRRDEPRMVRGVPRDRLIRIRFRGGQHRSIVPVGENDVFSVDSPSATSPR